MQWCGLSRCHCSSCSLPLFTLRGEALSHCVKNSLFVLVCQFSCHKKCHAFVNFPCTGADIGSEVGVALVGFYVAVSVAPRFQHDWISL